jgi:L-2-hydroxyglutarate oxidase LhgO
MSDSIDTAVIGGGVVGLAVARALALAGREVVLLEKNGGIGEETSSRNSEVVHAGLYYPTASLKARLCLQGRELLYAYCEERGVAYRRCGKLIVATEPRQVPKLETLREQALANGVRDVARLPLAELRALEPAVDGVAALWSPSTGILDTHGYLLALRGDLERAGGTVAIRTRVVAAAREITHWRLDCATEDGLVELSARTVVNAAGLHAVALAHVLEPDATDLPTAVFAKGHYFGYAGRSPFSRLVYPLPVEGGLGIHATLDLGGRLRFGPDVEWLPPDQDPEHLEYSVDVRRAQAFYGSIRSYWPDLPDGGLIPAYAGVRPKIALAGSTMTDFLIRQRTTQPRAIHLLGIESPGLTASLAIGAHVAAALAR